MATRLSTPAAAHTAAAADRRVHQRLDASRVQWIRAVKLRFGSEARVIDVSAGGILVETDTALKRHSQIVFEIEEQDRMIVVPSRVVRCHGTAVGDRIVFRSACAFSRPLTVPALVSQAESETGASTPESGAPQKAGATWQKVIARFRDGTLLRGYTSDFHASKPQLHLSSQPYSNDALFVPVAQLKALFFVREFAGNRGYEEKRTFVSPPQGRKLEITFHDGEVLLGSTVSYRPTGQGFFVVPCDSRSNNQRVFVVAGAIRHLRFL